MYSIYYIMYNYIIYNMYLYMYVYTTSALLTMLEPLTVWITANCGKFLKRWEYQTTLPAS